MSGQQFMDEVGEMMRRERKLLGLFQAQVAQALDCSASTVSDYERGVTMMDAKSYVTLKAYFRRQHQNRRIAEAGAAQEVTA